MTGLVEGGDVNRCFHYWVNCSFKTGAQSQRPVLSHLHLLYGLNPLQIKSAVDDLGLNMILYRTAGHFGVFST